MDEKIQPTFHLGFCNVM